MRRAARTGEHILGAASCAFIGTNFVRQGWLLLWRHEEIKEVSIVDRALLPLSTRGAQPTMSVAPVDTRFAKHEKWSISDLNASCGVLHDPNNRDFGGAAGLSR